MNVANCNIFDLLDSLSILLRNYISISWIKIIIKFFKTHSKDSDSIWPLSQPNTLNWVIDMLGKAPSCPPSSTFKDTPDTRLKSEAPQLVLHLPISPEIVHLKQNHTDSTEHLTRHINSFPVSPTTSCSAGKLQMTTSKCLSGLSFVSGHSGSVFIRRDTSSTHSYSGVWRVVFHLRKTLRAAIVHKGSISVQPIWRTIAVPTRVKSLLQFYEWT